MDLEVLFCTIDDFCQNFAKQFNAKLIDDKQVKRARKSRLSLSEVMTIMIYVHSSSYRNFKAYYIEKILRCHCYDFPSLVSYNRLVELIPHSLIPLICYLNTRKGKCTGISFMDGMGIPICHNKRAKRNKVFEDLAGWGKSSVLSIGILVLNFI